jgi:DNA-binding GntR family transcriptional regulator
MSGVERRPPYVRIADELRKQITTGKIPRGAALPSYTAISRTHGVAVSTVQKAVGVLRVEGLVASTNGVATYVISRRRGRRDYGDTVQMLKELHRRLDTLEAAVHDLQDFTGRNRRSRSRRPLPNRS